jgi:hypothetical protein
MVRPGEKRMAVQKDENNLFFSGRLVLKPGRIMPKTAKMKRAMASREGRATVKQSFSPGSFKAMLRKPFHDFVDTL